MTPHEIFLDWIYLANKGVKKAEFNMLSEYEIKALRNKESGWIKRSKIYIKNGKTVIELI